MTAFSRLIFERYQTRKTKKPKQAFIALMQEHFPEVTVQEGSFPKCRNLIVGDVENAKIILTAHYDTCSQLPFPNFIAPKNALFTLLYSLLIIIPLVALILLTNWLLGLYHLDITARYAASLVIYLVFMLILLAGPPNKHTANDNTSGVITLLEIYHRLTAEEKQNVCFVFFDNEEMGLLGSAQFRKQYKQQIKDKLLINFDCVSDGDTFMLSINKAANQKYHVSLAQSFTPTDSKAVLLENSKKIYYPSDQAGFPVAVAVASLKYKKPFGYYMDRIHTKRDTVFQEENIRYLADSTAQFINCL